MAQSSFKFLHMVDLVLKLDVPSLLFLAPQASLFTKYLHRLTHLNVFVNQLDVIIKP